MKSIATWLNSLPGINNARSVQVTIGKKVYQGARYTQTLHYQDGMRIVQEGKVKAGDSYTSDAVLLLGDRPKHRKKGTCYPFGGDEWYVACYYEKNDKNEYHPFGKCFTIKPWGIKGEKIDAYERWPYDRVVMQIEEL